MKYDTTTYWLHAGLAFSVSTQLMLGLMMDAPRQGVPIGGVGDLFFQVHRVAGLIVLVLLAAHWLWQISGRASNGMKSLYPWLLKRRQPPSPPSRMMLLAGTVQGLGLLIASLMAITGLVMFFGVASDGGMSTTVATIRETHAIIANLLWTYLGLHLAISLYKFI